MAMARLTDELETRKDTIWYDTMSRESRDIHNLKVATSRRPEAAISAGTVCLKQFDADTAKFWGPGYAHYITAILLMAHRDQDAHRFAQRVLDSMRQKPYEKQRATLEGLTRVYGEATPARITEAKRYYAEWLDVLKSDSLPYN